MYKVAFLTDFGDSSFELAHLKAGIMLLDEEIQLIDVTHQIRPFDISEAYFFMNNLWQPYPNKTIFALSVGNSIGKKNAFLVAKLDGKVFVAPDNGLLPMFLPKDSVSYFFSTENASLKDVLIQLIADKLDMKRWEEASNPIERIPEKAQFNDQLVKGAIVHIDRYGNLYTNISKKIFDQELAQRNYSIRVKRDERIEKVSQSISEVQDGDLMAYFDITEMHLIVGVNKGNASRLLGLEKGKYIFIEKLN